MGSSNKLNGVRVPVLSPISVMYADGVHVEVFVVALVIHAGGMRERMAR
jgi:hypothetical protein